MMSEITKNRDHRLEEILKARGWESLTAGTPKGLYRPVLQLGEYVWTSGHLPIRPDGSLIVGQVGEDLDEAVAAEAAALAMAGILRSLQQHLGSLDRVVRVVRLFGLVNAATKFTAHPKVLNGASELLAEIFGPEMGVGVRTAAGAGSLPLGAAVELEAVFQVTG
jgi:enamine deaminase RidA (YjgF/YER057c/UK114 family)